MSDQLVAKFDARAPGRNEIYRVILTTQNLVIDVESKRRKGKILIDRGDSGLKIHIVSETSVSIQMSEFAPRSRNGFWITLEADPADIATLQAWIVPLAKKANDEVGSMGLGLIAAGVISIVLPELLDPTWGLVLIGVGVADLIFRSAWMFFVNGAVLIAAGFMNGRLGLEILMQGQGANVLCSAGVIQVVWGGQQLWQALRYRRAQG